MLLMGRPGNNLRRRAFVFSSCLDPLQNLSITFAGRQLLFQLVGIDAYEREELLVQRTGVFVIMLLTGQLGTAFIQHSRQNDIAAEANTRAARRTLGEINKVVWHSLI